MKVTTNTGETLDPSKRRWYRVTLKNGKIVQTECKFEDVLKEEIKKREENNGKHNRANYQT